MCKRYIRQARFNEGKIEMDLNKVRNIGICAHIDERCNDDLSGCILGMEIMKGLEQMEDREFTYQLLWVPEMFGPIFYANENPDIIKKTYKKLDPQIISNYLEDLAAKFHKYYSQERIVSDNSKLTNARIVLIKSIQIVLENGLSILGIERPKKM